MIEKTSTEESAGKTGLARRYESLGWGSFIIWVGFCILVGIGFNLALLGIGVITLVFQYLRKINGLPLENFWLIAGILFVLGATWGFAGLKFPLVPILIIIAGVIVVMQAVREKDKPG